MSDQDNVAGRLPETQFSADEETKTEPEQEQPPKKVDGRRAAAIRNLEKARAKKRELYLARKAAETKAAEAEADTNTAETSETVIEHSDSDDGEGDDAEEEQEFELVPRGKPLRPLPAKGKSTRKVTTTTAKVRGGSELAHASQIAKVPDMQQLLTMMQQQQPKPKPAPKKRQTKIVNHVHVAKPAAVADPAPKAAPPDPQSALRKMMFGA